MSAQQWLDASGPIQPDTCYGELIINDVTLHTPAWCVTDLSELWGSFELRGSNRLIPGMRGRKAYVRRVDETRYSLPMVITGYCDPNGTPWNTDDPDVYYDIYAEAYGHGPAVTFANGLENNVAILQNSFRLDDPTAVPQSLFDADFVLPSGTVRSSQVQVLALRGQLQPGAVMFATLEILDPSAGLMVAGV